MLLMMLRDGRLHLSGIVRLVPHLTVENRQEMLRRATHKSKRQIEELVAEPEPQPDARAQMRKLPARPPTAFPASTPESSPASGGTKDAEARPHRGPLSVDLMGLASASGPKPELCPGISGPLRQAETEIRSSRSFVRGRAEPLFWGRNGLQTYLRPLGWSAIAPGHDEIRAGGSQSESRPQGPARSIGLPAHGVRPLQSSSALRPDRWKLCASATRLAGTGRRRPRPLSIRPR
jgi:hypothetical protein